MGPASRCCRRWPSGSWRRVAGPYSHCGGRHLPRPVLHPVELLPPVVSGWIAVVCGGRAAAQTANAIPALMCAGGSDGRPAGEPRACALAQRRGRRAHGDGAHPLESPDRARRGVDGRRVGARGRHGRRDRQPFAGIARQLDPAGLDLPVFLGDTQSVSALSRESSTHALHVWQMSPIVGSGFGYPYPDFRVQRRASGSVLYAQQLHERPGQVRRSRAGRVARAVVMTLWRLVRTLREPAALMADRVLSIGLAAAVVQTAALSVLVPALTSSDSITSFGLLIGLAVAHRRIVLVGGP